MKKIDLVIISNRNIDKSISEYISKNNLQFNKVFIVSENFIDTIYKNVIYKDFVNEEYINTVNSFNVVNEIDNIRYLSLYYYIMFEEDIIKNKSLSSYTLDKIKKEDTYHYSAKLFLKHFFNRTQVNKIEGFVLLNKEKIKKLKDDFPEIFHNSSLNNNKGFKHNIFLLYNYILI